jgi:hypothetical protein
MHKSLPATLDAVDRTESHNLAIEDPQQSVVLPLGQQSL